MVIVFEAQESVTPDGRPVAVPMPVAPVVVWMISVRAVLRHTVGVAVFARIRQPHAGGACVKNLFIVVLGWKYYIKGIRNM